jgi:Leucine rich repeat N-terminal domain
VYLSFRVAKPLSPVDTLIRHARATTLSVASHGSRSGISRDAACGERWRARRRRACSAPLMAAWQRGLLLLALLLAAAAGCGGSQSGITRKLRQQPAAVLCDAVCRAQQRSALLGLYAALGGDGWTERSGWGGLSDHCTWQGVLCCGSQSAGGGSGACALAGGVAGLSLAAVNATGRWPAGPLAALAASLAYINLRGNKLTGDLPESIASLRQLSALHLDDNSLSGPLPAALGALPLLMQLSASRNMLGGPLPPGLARASMLRSLLLDGNQLRGPLPYGLLTLPALVMLSLSSNQLTGTLHDAVGGGGVVGGSNSSSGGSGGRASAGAISSVLDVVAGAGGGTAAAPGCTHACSPTTQVQQI